MSHDYKMVGWTPFKKRYDLFVGLGVLLYLVLFFVGTMAGQPAGESLHPLQTMLRATGTLAFILLTFILSIGPLARLTDRAKPFLYNRRHLGVTTFLIALVHAGLVVLWYHGFSETNAFVSLFASNPRYDSLQGFPFELLGVGAFFILFVMAATSHDFWNANLGPGFWKALHMGVYIAYALLVGHVMLGFIQDETSMTYTALIAGASAWLVMIHLIASGRVKTTQPADDLEQGWLTVAPIADFEDGRAKIVTPAEGERIAVFLYDGKISAVSNVCRHQGGPLGEGRIIDGCITCPWHGFQYRPEDGQSPAPFTEKIATYDVKIHADSVLVRALPNPPGTQVTPALIQDRSRA